MKHDFGTYIDRTRLSSWKWEEMRKLKPDVSRGIVPFSTADMEFRNAPEIVDGLKEYLDSAVLGYPSPSDGEYLSSVCEWMESRHDWKIRPEWIFPTPGVVDAIFWAVQAFSGPGDGVIVQTPVYYPFYDAISRNGRVIARNPLVLSGGCYTIDFGDLEEKASDPANRILLFCSPHNPVGRVWTAGELARVGEICARHDLFIISDEIHFDLIMPGHRHTVFATLSGELADRMMVCTAPSKTFNLAGMKTSNIIIPNRSRRELFAARAGGNGFTSLNILGYKACEIAYRKCGKWLDEAISAIHGNHLALRDFISSRVPGVKAFDLEGTYLQWLDFSGLGLDPDSLDNLLIRKAELFFDDGLKFGSEGAGFKRMNIACPGRVLADALARLEKAVKEP